jgi:hypothetical protein
MAETRQCEWCGVALAPNKNRFCDRSCSRSWQNSHPGEHPVRTKKCEWCGAEFKTKGRGTNRFCDKSCSAKWRMNQPEHAAKVHTPETHRKIGDGIKAWYDSGTPSALANIERTRAMKPMSDPAVRAKVSERLREIGHCPPIQGGNGRPLPLPQRILLELLGAGWEPEYAISLGKRQEGYPTCYKVDLGNPGLKIAIEADGFSHVALKRRAMDRKKDDKLAELGWTVLRFSNQEILNSAGSVVERILSYCSTFK